MKSLLLAVTLVACLASPCAAQYGRGHYQPRFYNNGYSAYTNSFSGPAYGVPYGGYQNYRAYGYYPGFQQYQYQQTPWGYQFQGRGW